jgi:outer membrane protein OmpA-like peptidoglycan-associated protein
MMRTRLLAVLAALTFISPAMAATNQKEAVTKTGRAVVSTSGECVRTKWHAESDPCAPEPPPAPQAYVPPAPKVALADRTVYFEFNKAELSADDKAKLDSLAQIIINSKGIRHATVLGYADEIGKADANLVLSQKRAAAVNDYLATRITIPTSVLMVGGKGATNSVTNCPESMKRKERISCLAADRRVEVEFNYVH